MPIKAILTDIEGTTSSIGFVTQVLFPFAARHLPDFVRAQASQPDVLACLQAVREASNEPDADLERVIEILLHWLAEDRKATPLKTLQGMVWEQGYRSGQLKGHVYPDAVAALRHWHQAGYALYVYSSGSIQAQQLVFSCSEVGDLSELFSGYFDTTSGPKRDVQSYRNIAQAIGLAAEDILFLSDIVEELNAAHIAGLATCGLLRGEGTLSGHRHESSFAEIDPAIF